MRVAVPCRAVVVSGAFVGGRPVSVWWLVLALFGVLLVFGLVFLAGEVLETLRDAKEEDE